MYYRFKERRSNAIIEKETTEIIYDFRNFCFCCDLSSFDRNFGTPKFHALYELGKSREEIGPCYLTETSTKEAKHKEYRK